MGNTTKDWRRTCIPAVVQIVDGRLCLSLPLVPCIYITNQVVTDVVANLSDCQLGVR